MTIVYNTNEFILHKAVRKAFYDDSTKTEVALLQFSPYRRETPSLHDSKILCLKILWKLNSKLTRSDANGLTSPSHISTSRKNNRFIKFLHCTSWTVGIKFYFIFSPRLTLQSHMHLSEQSCCTSYASI